LLVPKEGSALTLEAVARDGSTTPMDLDLDGAIALYNEAVGALPDGIKFDKPAGEALADLRSD
jgi:CRISPR-associated protein Csb1